MQYSDADYEETIDLMALLAEVLHKWKWLLCALLAGALLFGGYRLLVPAKPDLDEDAITELQASIDNNQATLTGSQTTLETNASTIAADTEKIPATEELLGTYTESKETLQKNLDTSKEALQSAQSTLSDAGLSAAERASVIVQLPTLTNDIAETDAEIRSVSERINEAKQSIAAMQKEIEDLTRSNETLTSELTDLQAQLAQQQQELSALQEGTISFTSRPVGSAAIGGVLGLLAICFVLLFRFLFDKRLRCAQELRERYRLPILGEFYSERYQKHNQFDRMLDAWAGDSQTLPDKQEVYKLIAAGIHSAIPEGARLAITGTLPQEKLLQVSNALSSLLPESCQPQALSNPVYNPAFLADIRQYTVLLVEAKGTSDKAEIVKLAELLSRTGVPVLGAVVC